MSEPLKKLTVRFVLDVEHSSLTMRAGLVLLNTVACVRSSNWVQYGCFWVMPMQIWHHSMAQGLFDPPNISPLLTEKQQMMVERRMRFCGLGIIEPQFFYPNVNLYHRDFEDDGPIASIINVAVPEML